MPSLDFDSLLRSFPKGQFAPVYYFHGEQDVLKDDAVRTLLDHAIDPGTRDFNLDRRRAADLTADDLQSLILTPPMLAERRAVVITELEALQQKRPRAQAARAALLAYAARPSTETLLILVQSSGETPVDSDLARKATAVDFKTLEPGRIRKWIRLQAVQVGLALDDDAVEHLFDVVGGDLAQTLTGIAKLKSAVGDRAATADDVADLVGVQRGETTHEFVNAVTGRGFAEAAGMVTHLLNAPGQSGVQLLMALSTAFTSLDYARAVLDGGGGAAAANLKTAFFESRPAPFLVRDYGERSSRWAKDAAKWSPAEIDAALAALLRADRRLKSANVGGEAEIVQEAILAMAAVKQGAQGHRGTGARLILALVFSVPLCPCAPVPLFSQDSPSLRAAVQLAAEGRSDSARRIVAAQLVRTRPSDPLYAEALYWRARLAAHADSAEHDLRRVAIEFSTSRWADDAMLQLAQLALAAGHPSITSGHAQRLRADYPESELRAQAAYWAGRAGLDAGDLTAGCALLDSARAEAPGDIEFQNQVAFYRARCTAVAVRDAERGARNPVPTVVDSNHPRADPAAAAAPPVAPVATAPPTAETVRTPSPAPVTPSPVPGPPSPASSWEVQVAAARSDAAARDVVTRLARNGQEARVVAGADGYFRVRLGPFATLRAAQDAAMLARRVVTDRPFVVRP